MLGLALDGERCSLRRWVCAPPGDAGEEGGVPPPVGAALCLQVTLWKGSVDGQWVCISDVNKGQGPVSTSVTEGQQNDQ